MGVTSNAITYSQLRILSKGTGTITGSGAVQDLFNFNCPALTGGERVIIDVWLYKTLGANALTFYFGPTAGAATGAGTLNTTCTAAGTLSVMKFTLAQDKVDTAKSSVLCSGWNNAAASTTADRYDIVVSAAEVIYAMASNAAAGNDAKYSYIAYLIS